MAKVKNPFKKQSLTDALVNVGIGGAANVAVDAIFNSLLSDVLDEYSDTVKNGIKIVGGAVVGGMVNNKYARAAADGVAIVGVSNLIAGFMDKKPSDKDTPEVVAPDGLPKGTVGRIRLGNQRFKRAGRGLSGGFMQAD